MASFRKDPKALRWEGECLGFTRMEGRRLLQDRGTQGLRMGEGTLFTIPSPTLPP